MAVQPCDSPVAVPSLTVVFRHFSPWCDGLAAELANETGRRLAWRPLREVTDLPAARRAWTPVAQAAQTPVQETPAVDVYAGPARSGRNCWRCTYRPAPALRTRWLGRRRKFEDAGARLVLLPELGRSDRHYGRLPLLDMMLAAVGPSWPAGRGRLWLLPGPYVSWLAGPKVAAGEPTALPQVAADTFAPACGPTAAALVDAGWELEDAAAAAAALAG